MVSKLSRKRLKKVYSKSLTLTTYYSDTYVKRLNNKNQPVKDFRRKNDRSTRKYKLS